MAYISKFFIKLYFLLILQVLHQFHIKHNFFLHKTSFPISRVFLIALLVKAEYFLLQAVLDVYQGNILFKAETSQDFFLFLAVLFILQRKYFGHDSD